MIGVKTEKLIQISQKMCNEALRMNWLAARMDCIRCALQEETDTLDTELVYLHQQTIRLKEQIDALFRMSRILQKAATDYEHCERKCVNEMAWEENTLVFRAHGISIGTITPLRGIAYSVLTPLELNTCFQTNIKPLMKD